MRWFHKWALLSGLLASAALPITISCNIPDIRIVARGNADVIVIDDRRHEDDDCCGGFFGWFDWF